jgi:hypothetical protein
MISERTLEKSIRIFSGIGRESGTSSYGAFNLHRDLICKSFLLGKIQEDTAILPIQFKRRAFNIIASDKQGEIIIPLSISGNSGGCSSYTSNTIMNVMSSINSSGYLFKVYQKDIGNPLYIGNHIILDKDFKPLLLGIIHYEKKALGRYEVPKAEILISPNILNNNNNICKDIIKYLVPYYTRYNSSFMIPLGYNTAYHGGVRTEAVISNRIHDFFTYPESHSIHSTDVANTTRTLVDNSDEIIKNLVG